MIAFDLLYLNGRDLRRVPLEERKKALQALISDTPIQYSEHFEIDGAELYQRACQAGLEGIVSKVAGSPYVGGRGNYWFKTTCAHRETLAIAGFALDGSKWDGIFLGRRKGEDLIYAGKVDHGFDKASETELRKRLKPLIRKTQPYAKRVAHKASGSSPSCWRRSSIGASRPRARSGIHSSRACGRTCDGPPDPGRADRKEL